MRFYAPYTIDAHIVRNTIQIVPRLEGPTLLKEVLVEPNVPVKKGQPLYKFDTTTYDEKLKSAQAKLAAAEQNVAIMQADVEAATSQLAEARAQLAYSQQQQQRFNNLAKGGGARQEDVDKWNSEVEANTAAVSAATANLQKAELALDMNIDGVNTNVAEAQAEVAQAEYYLSQTTIYAPEDGFVVNQQAWPGLVVGDFRIGAIAAFVTDRDPYMLVTIRSTSSWLRPARRSRSRSISIRARSTPARSGRSGGRPGRASMFPRAESQISHFPSSRAALPSR